MAHVEELLRVLPNYKELMGKTVCNDSPMVLAMELEAALTLNAGMHGHGWQDTLNGYPWLATKVAGMLSVYCKWAIKEHRLAILSGHGYDDFGSWLASYPTELAALYEEAVKLEYLGGK